jgi:hypothetical protein
MRRQTVLIESLDLVCILKDYLMLLVAPAGNRTQACSVLLIAAKLSKEAKEFLDVKEDIMRLGLSNEDQLSIW